MNRRITPALLSLLALLALSSCGSMAPTRAGEAGHWAVTRYLVRNYVTDMQSAFDAGKRYFAQAGYEVTDSKSQGKSWLLHGFTEGRKNSLILRLRDKGKGMVRAEMKAGPEYSMEGTRGMMDAYQKLLPESAQPK